MREKAAHLGDLLGDFRFTRAPHRSPRAPGDQGARTRDIGGTRTIAVAGEDVPTIGDLDVTADLVVAIPAFLMRGTSRRRG